MLLYLPAHCFLLSWRLTVRCDCKAERRILLPAIEAIRLRGRDERTLSNLTRRLVCQQCRQRPSRVIAEHEPSNVRDELIA